MSSFRGLPDLKSNTQVINLRVLGLSPIMIHASILGLSAVSEGGNFVFRKRVSPVDWNTLFLETN